MFAEMRAVIASFCAIAALYAPSSANSPESQSGSDQPLEIIVIGSSTAAGKNLYKAFGRPKSEAPTYERGYNWATQFGAALRDAGRNATIYNYGSSAGHSASAAANAKKGDALYKNSIDFALSQRPGADILIVNFPSVRSNAGETIESAIASLKEIETRAKEAGVSQVWLTTAQPTADATQCVASKKARCSAAGTVLHMRVAFAEAIIAAFPDHHVDFYTPLAKGHRFGAPANKALLVAGDEQHPNVEGHKALAQALIQAGIGLNAAGASSSK